MDVKEQDRKNPSSVPPLVKATYVLKVIYSIGAEVLFLWQPDSPSIWKDSCITSLSPYWSATQGKGSGEKLWTRRHRRTWLWTAEMIKTCTYPFFFFFGLMWLLGFTTLGISHVMWESLCLRITRLYGSSHQSTTADEPINQSTAFFLPPAVSYPLFSQKLSTAT